ncbi:hypothetical protein CULT_1730010 [[Clostridium] ultunense Esp]|nr:hypothetical protein CULT_1730010 [[Clostridium] ultunense Esp]
MRKLDDGNHLYLTWVQFFLSSLKPMISFARNGFENLKGRLYPMKKGLERGETVSF